MVYQLIWGQGLSGSRAAWLWHSMSTLKACEKLRIPVGAHADVPVSVSQEVGGTPGPITESIDTRGGCDSDDMSEVVARTLLSLRQLVMIMKGNPT